MQDYWVEFLTLALLHLLAVASPGPDFAVVCKQVFAHGRHIGIWTSIGVGVGILMHVAFSLFGLGLVLMTTPWLYQLLVLLAVLYFLYIGVQSLRSQPAAFVQETGNSSPGMTPHKAFRLGFITNGINPKATLFFLSLFTVVIATSTPLGVKIGYGIYLASATAIWFIMLSVVLSTTKVDQWLARYKHWIERGMGGMLIMLALSLFIQEWL